MLVSRVTPRFPLATPIALRRIRSPFPSRKLSSLLSPRPSRSRSGPLARPTSKGPPRVLPLASLRFNSTDTTTPSPAPLPPLPPVEDPPTFLPDYIPTVESLSAPLPASEHIGFLKEFGLDYGYGVTSIVQTLLEHIHVYTGTPWYGSIIITVAVIRLLQFPFYLKMSDTAARMKELNPFVLPLSKRMREAQVNGDKTAMLATRMEITNIYKVSKVKRRWLFFPLTQVPVFYGFYKTLRGMAEVPVPGLADGGIAWFTDLSVADPFYLLPAMTSAALFTQLSMGGEAGTNLQTEKMRRTILILLPTLTLTFASFWPAVLSLYFCCNSAISLLQTSVLKNAWVRDRFQLYPLAQTALENPLSPAPPKASPPNTEEVKQIGGKGSWLDKITGGDKPKKDAEETGLFGGLFDGGGDKAKHKSYEEKREARLAQERKITRERRERKKWLKELEAQDRSE